MYMKLIIKRSAVCAFAVALVFLSVGGIGGANAQNTGSFDAQIQALMAQIKALQQQLVQLQVQQSGGTAPWCYTFDNNLRFGDGGSQNIHPETDVRNLQLALEKEGFQGSDSEKRGGAVFGESTAAAVTGFQEKYRDEVLTPSGLKYGTGYVGKATRAKLNKLYGCSGITPPHSPAPISIKTSSNLSGAVGQAFQAIFEASGGQAPYSFSWAKGDMPPGLGLVNPPQPLSAQSSIACKIDTLTGASHCPVYNQTSVWLQGTPITAGTYKIWLAAQDKNGVTGYGEFTIVIVGDQSGRLYIEGGSSVGVGQSIKLKAIYQPPMTVCPPGLYCAQVMPVPYQVNAEWTSSDPNIASVSISTPGCVGGTNYCGQEVLVKGISNGVADIKAAYKLSSGSILTATTKITVSSTPSTSSVPIISSITVISPNGGEVWQEGHTYAIKWSSLNLPQNAKVAITLFDPRGANANIVSNLGFSQGTYDWTVDSSKLNFGFGSVYPSRNKIVLASVQNTRATLASLGSYGSGFKILVSAYWGSNSDPYYGNTYDYSDASFSIVSGSTAIPTFSVVAPTVSWVAGSAQTIKWSSLNYPSTVAVLIQLYQDTVSGGHPQLTPYLSLRVPNSGSAVWTIPATTQQAPNYRISVTCDEAGVKSYGSCSGGMSQAFSIVAAGTAPAVKVVAPNGGEKLNLGFIYPVIVSFTPGTVRPEVAFSLYQGTARLGNLVGTRLSDEQFSWEVGKYENPNGVKMTAPQGSGYFIALATPNSNGPVDQSDASFSVVATPDAGGGAYIQGGDANLASLLNSFQTQLNAIAVAAQALLKSR